MSISALGGPQTYHALQALQASRAARPPQVEAETQRPVEPAGGASGAGGAKANAGEDRVNLSAAGQSKATAYEALKGTSRVISEDTPGRLGDGKSQTAADLLRQQSRDVGRDQAGQAASRLHVIA